MFDAGVAFRSVRIDQDARAVEGGEMDAIGDETDLKVSPAAQGEPPASEHS